MRIDIGGRRLFFDVSSEGLVPDGPRLRERPTLIAIHGAPGFSDHATFKPAFRPLADDIQVIYLDLSGLDELDRVRCPVLVMAGELDPITPLEDSEDIVARLDPEIVQFCVMSGCGHGCWRDKSEESLAAIRSFVMRHWHGS